MVLLVQKSNFILKELKLDRNLQALPEDFKNIMLSPFQLLNGLSFTHFVELLKVEDSTKRLFYEIECLKGNWTVRQLRRQIGSLLCERTMLSYDKAALLAQLEQPLSSPSVNEVIRDPYVFEFLGLTMKETFSEKDLEKALLDHLQQFLIEEKKRLED